jgi:uncharacterized membrane protein YdcZ (DUF606 family)
MKVAEMLSELLVDALSFDSFRWFACSLRRLTAFDSSFPAALNVLVAVLVDCAQA